MPQLPLYQYRLRELYDADFDKPGIHGRARVRANAWNAFRRALSRGGRGRWVDVGFVVCFQWGGIFLRFFFSSNAHGLLQVRGHLASFTSLLINGGYFVWFTEYMYEVYLVLRTY